MIFVNIDSEGGLVQLGDYSISWGNSEDPFFENHRLEGFCAFNAGQMSIEFGCVDQDRPGIYLVRYEDGDVRSVQTILSF